VVNSGMKVVESDKHWTKRSCQTWTGDWTKFLNVMYIGLNAVVENVLNNASIITVALQDVSPFILGPGQTACFLTQM